MLKLFHLESREARKRSKTIDKELRKEKKDEEVKVLVVGAAGPGKDVLVNGMQRKRFEDAGARITMKPQIQSFVIESVRDIIRLSKLQNINFQTEENKEIAIKLENAECVLSTPMAHDIGTLWKDSGIQTIFSGSNIQDHLKESIRYFMDDVYRIGSSDYVPSEKDCQRYYPKETSVALVREAKFEYDTYKINLVTVEGQRDERRKWTHQFENVTSVLFVLDAAEYDQVTEGDLEYQDHNSGSKLMSSIRSFKGIAKDKWLQGVGIIVAFTRIDVLEKKLEKKPFQEFISNYKGNNTSKDVISYIQQQLVLDLPPRSGSIKFQILTSDTENVFDKIWEDVKTILKDNTLHSLYGDGTHQTI